MVLRKDHAQKINFVVWLKACSRVQGGNWSKIGNFECTYFSYLFLTAGQNKKTSSNWQPFPRNKVPAWLNKSTF